MKLIFSAILMVAFLVSFVSASFAEVIVLFDEDAKTEAGKGAFVPLFSSHDAGSTVTITKDEAISGKVSAFCTPQQSYNPNFSGWRYPIDETPWITFGWKKDGGKIIMLQLAFDGNWAYRYHDGDNAAPGWASTQLAKDIPKEWVLYTRNLSKDFKAGWNLTGFAFTPWDGVGGYYDFLILHTKENEGKIVGKAVETKGKLSTEWGKIKQN